MNPAPPIPDPPFPIPFSEALLSGAAELGLPLPEADLAAYRAHYALLQEHNPRAGLTSLTDPVEIALKHYLDSLTCLLLRDLAPGEHVADLGSGAGFPGLVLAIARPTTHFTLVDSSTKRTSFLRAAADSLNLRNATVLTTRAETLGRDPAHRERYDLVLSRALAPLPVLLEYSLPLARLGRHVLAMKGPEADAELAASDRALSLLGGRLTQIRHLALPLSFGSRTLLLFEKTDPTPPRYPRRPGIPSRRPIR
jgi:16S rRNA (guanine527-N7)-methyltransferase